MINITFNAKEGRIWMSGHSGYAEPGSDIVCAGISALYETLAMHPMTYAGKDCKANNEHFVLAKPDTYCMMRPVFEAFATGMEAIAKRYPENVKFDRIE